MKALVSVSVGFYSIGDQPRGIVRCQELEERVEQSERENPPF